jgi:1-acyl-sn-glycerol-3-phosphate acyltransferase
MVADLTEVFAREPSLILLIPTEATRARTEFWKSGFYRIAKGAGVPIVPTYLDYRLRRGGFGAALQPTGDVSADMQYFRDFYSDKFGLYPEQFGPVRLREEMTDEAA